MANQYISTKRTEQGALAASGSTLVPCVDSGVSTVHTVDELATAIGGYTVPVISQASVRSAKVYSVDELNNGSYLVPANIAWTALDHDDGGWWGVGLPQRLVVPAGVTKVCVTLGLLISNSSTVVSITKNGTTDPLVMSSGTTTCNLSTGAIPVVAGDYFEAYLTTANGNIQASPVTFFSIFEVEGSP